MPKMLITVNISKGFKTWTDMARSLEDEAGANGAAVDGSHSDTDSIAQVTKGTAGAVGVVAGASIGYTMAFDDMFSVTIDGQWNPMDHSFKADDAANTDDVDVNMDHMYTISIELNANVTDNSAVYAKFGHSEFELEASGSGLDNAQSFDLDGEVYAIGTKTLMDNGVYFKSEIIYKIIIKQVYFSFLL